MRSTLGSLLELGRPSVDNKFAFSQVPFPSSERSLSLSRHNIYVPLILAILATVCHSFKAGPTPLYINLQKRTPFHVRQFVLWAISNEPVSCKSCPFHSTVLWQLAGLENLWIAISLSVGAIKLNPNCELEGSKLKIVFTTVYGTWPVVWSYLNFRGASIVTILNFDMQQLNSMWFLWFVQTSQLSVEQRNYKLLFHRRMDNQDC